MAKFNVMQLVSCEVNVWYSIEADNQQEAERLVKLNNTPTCVDGADYEIVSDDKILLTKIKEA